MTVLSHGYNKKHKNIVFVLPKGEGVDHPLLKGFVGEIKRHNLHVHYNIFFAGDFIRIKHHRTETANEFKVRHNIYAHETKAGFVLRVSEGQFMEKNGKLEPFDMNYPTRYSGKDLAPAQVIDVNLLVPVKEPALNYFIGVRQNDIEAVEILKPAKEIKGMFLTRMITYESLDAMVNTKKSGQIKAFSHRALEGAIKQALDEPERYVRAGGAPEALKRIREGQSVAREELKKMGLEVGK